jgi:hypothetical protein
MTEPPSRRQRFLATTSAKIAAGLAVVIVLASIPMVIAHARRSTTSAERAASPTSRERPMPPPANPPQAALTPGQKTQVALQVTSLHAGNRITGRILRPVDPTTLAHTQQTITVQFEPGAAITMGSSAGIKPGALLEANGTIAGNRTLDAESIVVLTGYVQLR